VVTRQPWIRRRSGKVRQLRTDVLTTEPRRQLAILWKKIVIWNDFRSNHKISNRIQIKSHVFQIKSLFFKWNHYVWFNHDL